MRPVMKLVSALLVSALLVACGGELEPLAGETNPPPAGGISPPPKSQPGATEPMADGCNTCTCSDNGEWACTTMSCREPQPEPTACEQGDTRNGSCTCVDGQWACADTDPGPAHECPPPATPDFDGAGHSCPAGVVWLRTTWGLCCSYANICAVPQDFGSWQTSGTEAECQ